LIWKREQFERHCGELGLIDPDETFERFELPEGVDYLDLIEALCM
jgi:hypothetical protein